MKSSCLPIIDDCGHKMKVDRRWNIKKKLLQTSCSGQSKEINKHKDCIYIYLDLFTKEK